MQIDFDKITEEYKKFINTKYIIPLSNNDTINFIFKGEHLPHLLGLNKLVDIPLLQRYANKLDDEIGGNYIWNAMCEDDDSRECYLDMTKLSESIHFEEIYNDKLKYFDLSKLMEPLKIIEFDPSKVKKFVPKIDKVCYMFWDYFEESSKIGHFGIGFSFVNNKYFPNTFFYRNDSDYLSNQKEVFPHSYLIKHPDKSVEFSIKWDNIRNSLSKTKHYKCLQKLQEDIGYDILDMNKTIIDNYEDQEAKRHFNLLRLDEIKLVYSPYLEVAKTWNNKTKAFLVEKIDLHTGDYLPNEIKSLLNEMPENYEVTPES